MSTLPANEKHCPGRIVRYFGGATIAAECADCLRRTEQPVHMTGPQLDPAQINALFRGYCANRITAEDLEVSDG